MKNRSRSILLALLALAFPLIAPACASTASPTPKDTFEPITSVPAKTATILVPNTIPSTINFDDIMDRLNSSLRAKGQNVEFQLRAVSYDNAGHNSFLTKAREELSAGNPAASAYALGFADSESFFNDKLTMDVTELVRQYAAGYYSKYGSVFKEKLTGIPVSVYGRPVWFKTALMLRQDFLEAGNGISTLDGLFRFLDEAVVKPGKNQCVLADPESLVTQWALEQGYYRLGLFGVDGYLYAAMKDPKCTPVPLESIPGLEVFLKVMMEYYKNGSLSSDFYTMYSREPVAFVKNLGDYYISNPFGWLSWIPGEFTAQVFSPELPSVFSEPTYVEELAIPATCTQSEVAEVVRFVDWYNSTQENYDVVLYGQKGMDFTVDGARFAPMKDGQKQSLKAISQMQGEFFTWPGSSALSNAEYYRLPASAPINVEQLYDAGLKANLRFEANKYIKADRETMDGLQDLSPGMADVCRARDDALNGLIYGAPCTYTETTYSQCMDKLAKLATSQLVADYQRVFAKIMNN